MAIVENAADKIAEIAQAGRSESIFGEPHEVDGATIIPIARVSVAFGFGGGGGEGTAPGEDGPKGKGEGSGGGGKMTISPVAVIRVKGGETTIEPVIDRNQVIKYIAIAGGILAFWIGLSIARLLKKK